MKHKNNSNSYLIIGLIIGFCMSLCSCEKLGKDVKTFWLNKQAREALDEGQLEKAVELYKELIELTPDDPGLYWDLGVAYSDMGEKGKARKQIEHLRKSGHEDLASRLENLIVQADSLYRLELDEKYRRK